MGSPGAPLIGSLTILGLLFLAMISDLSAFSLYVFAFLALFVMLEVVGLVRLGVKLLTSERRSNIRRHPIRWLTPMAIGVVVLVSAAVGAPAKFRFALSEDSFEKAARSALAGTSDRKPAPERLGLFEAEWIKPYKGTVRFVLDDGGDGIHAHGVIWSPGGEPPLPEEEGYKPDVQHYAGPWYLWSENF
jgi:hypothetical protein